MTREGDGQCGRLRGPARRREPAPADSRFLIVTEDPLRLWDARTLEPLGALTQEPGFWQAIFTRDGSAMLAVGWDGTVYRWPAGPAELVRRACAVSGRELTSAEWDRHLPEGGRRPACAPGS